MLLYKLNKGVDLFAGYVTNKDREIPNEQTNTERPYVKTGGKETGITGLQRTYYSISEELHEKVLIISSNERLYRI